MSDPHYKGVTFYKEHQQVLLAIHEGVRTGREVMQRAGLNHEQLQAVYKTIQWAFGNDLVAAAQKAKEAGII